MWHSTIEGAYCFYDNRTDSAYQVKWGALYNWHAVSNSRLAPEGWRIPSDADWDTLQNFLIANGCNWDGTAIGNKIGKAMAAQTDWHSWHIVGTIGNSPDKNNVSGFSALPGGCRYFSGDFGHQSNNCHWWSATESNASKAWFRSLSYGADYLSKSISNGLSKSCGLSVRIVRDKE